MPHRIFSLLSKSLALCAALLLVGGHWAVLQVAAWTGMILTYSSQDSLVVAVEKTFDGQHPCDLCKTISKGRSDEKAPARMLVQVAKLDAVIMAEVAVTEPLFVTACWSPVLESGESFLEAPPVPPPRLG